jgi:DNA (cytosine-5)-methyltransferase 1
MSKTCAEFFAGIGLMRMGLEKAGWRVGFANDICENKKEMYEKHFGPSSHFHLGDIHKIDAAELPDVSLATASFPCTDLSNAGGRAGLAGKQSSAYWGFIDILSKLGERRPKLVLLENVTAFLTSHQGNDFRLAMEALNKLGYSVDPFVINAENFVPQSRERLFVVARLHADSNPAMEVAAPPVFYQDHLRPRKLAEFIMDNPQIHWALRKMPPLPKRDYDLSRVIEDLDDTDPAWWSQQRAEYLFNQMGPSHKEAAEAMIAGDEIRYGTVFRRMRNKRSTAEMRRDGVAGCLRTPKGGSARQILFIAGRGSYRVRLLTAREHARLMGADDFKMDCPLNQAIFGFGDAVCVPVVEWIGRNYLNPVYAEIVESMIAA